MSSFAPQPLVFGNTFPKEALAVLGWVDLLQWLSTFGTTQPGKEALLNFNPACSVELAQARHDRGREATSALLADAAPGFSGVGDPHSVLAKCEQGLEGNELNDIASAIERLRELRAWAESRSEYVALGALLMEHELPLALLKRLRDSIDNRGLVKDEADPTLPKLREKLRQLRAERSAALESSIHQLSKRGLLRQNQPVRRGGRLLLVVKATPQGRGAGVVHDQSQSGDSLFVEPREVLEIANRLVEARARERRIVDAVLLALSAEVLREREALLLAVSALGEADAAFACAGWLEAVQGSWPELGALDSECVLQEARHPLLLQSMDYEEVVPLNLELGGAYDLLVVTGPNTGGKTVVLKTLGLLAAMARAGLPVSAADGTRLPMLIGLDADIGDQQSLETSLSTFSGHLTRMERFLKVAEAGHLILLDELGTGTDPEEGAALGRAVLEKLLEKGAKVVANTHLGDLKLFSLDQERAENASMEFDANTLAPSFRLLVGVPGASHAIEVAERLGLPEGILSVARQYAARGDGAETLLADVGRVRRDAELLREKAAHQEAELRERTRQIEKETAASARRQSLREGEAEVAYLDLLRELGGILDTHGKALLSSLAGKDLESADALLSEIRGSLSQTRFSDRRDQFIRSLKKGMSIWVPRYSEQMLVSKVDKKKEVVRVLHGSLDIEVPMREITWVEAPPTQNDKNSHSR